MRKLYYSDISVKIEPHGNEFLYCVNLIDPALVKYEIAPILTSSRVSEQEFIYGLVEAINIEQGHFDCA
jgi:hypothetical protein